MHDDAQGFDAFVEEVGRSLLRAGWLLTGDWHAAEDLVQTALERTWPRWPNLADEGHRIAYVRRVMMTSYLRGARRRWTHEIATGQLPETEVDAGIDEALLSVSLRAAASRLPPKQRACITLRYFLDLSEADTAAAMRIGVGTVKSNTARALQALRGEPSLVGLLTDQNKPCEGVAPLTRTARYEPKDGNHD